MMRTRVLQASPDEVIREVFDVFDRGTHELEILLTPKRSQGICHHIRPYTRDVQTWRGSK